MKKVQIGQRKAVINPLPPASLVSMIFGLLPLGKFKNIFDTVTVLNE
jgi:hypothetical protein